MKEKRELITEETFVLLDGEVYMGPRIGATIKSNTAVFVMRVEKPAGKPVTREQVLAWTMELAGRMYADYE